MQHDVNNQLEAIDEPVAGNPQLDIAGLIGLVGGFDLPTARRWMCQQLRALNISQNVISAMSTIPRHAFAPPSRWRTVYLNLDLWTGITWLTRPGTIGRVLDALPSKPSLRILEIGTGTGYQTSILAALGAKVLSVDVSQACCEMASERLRLLRASSVVVQVINGLATEAIDQKFDVVLINAAAQALPRGLLNLLGSDGGTIILPVFMSDGSQRLVRYNCSPDRDVTLLDLGECKFVPLIEPVEF